MEAQRPRRRETVIIYERFADHAVEISRRISFMDSGVLPTEDDISTY